MKRISRSVADLKPRYDVVVVGSGYGGSIAASRLARAGKSVCLLERGKEILPGEYPDTELEALGQVQIDAPAQHTGKADGLYDFRLNKDMNVFMGCGLGGTSLVNANVSLKPEDRVFDDEVWPAALKADDELRHGFARAEAMLQPVLTPLDLTKTNVHRKCAVNLGPFAKTPINVTFADGQSPSGVPQKACTHCGDCVSGCNVGAKNTVLMNYLPDAFNFGAEIFTGVEVSHVKKKADGRWLVNFHPVGVGRERFAAPGMHVDAELVVLAGGSLGSTEILLRSAEAGLSCSNMLGKRFTGNGDVLAFAYNCDEPVHGIGTGEKTRRNPPGPCITSVIDLRNQPNLEDGMVIEEGSIPGGMARFLPGILRAAAELGKDTDGGFIDETRERVRIMDSLVRGPYVGAVDHTQIFLVMTHDDGSGELKLKDDRLRIRWPGVGSQPIFEAVKKNLIQATSEVGGTYVPNPTWHELFGHSLITVHPLGGCPMGEDAVAGAVDHTGAVFSGKDGTEIHAGLHVLDGAILPRPVGVNPLFTISALAERGCQKIAESRGWAIDFATKIPADVPELPVTKPGLRFTETMRGRVGDGTFEEGEKNGEPCEFTLTVVSEDVQTMLSDEAHRAKLVGTVNAPGLSPAPLTVTEGTFQLFVEAPQVPETREMRYRIRLVAEDGSEFFFVGFKTIHRDFGLELWADTTTLFVTIYDGADDTGPVKARGTLHILVPDFMKQMTTMEVTRAKDTAQRLALLGEFGTYFAGSLFAVYGGIAVGGGAMDPTSKPRKKRPLRAGPPEVHPFKTDDGFTLLLTRYRGGDKGPVILSHGLGVSSLIFSIDTIETNLLEYLFAHGYDVWLLDYRSSIALDCSREASTADDVATFDYPAAVKTVRAVTGADSVQMVVHCFGATTFFMAMLAGLEGVRSAVVSQIATQIRAPFMTRIKTGLQLPSLMDVMGIDSLTAETSPKWNDRLIDQALKLQPIEREERCSNPVCRRIVFLYAQLYEHDQLNEATHRAMHEMFGVAHIDGFKHLAMLVNKGHLVSAEGKEIYMPHQQRLAIPITFIHGEENACFLPESTERTFEELTALNGNLYERHVIPRYGHIDCIFGKNAAVDVFPLMLDHLERSS